MSLRTGYWTMFALGAVAALAAVLALALFGVFDAGTRPAAEPPSTGPAVARGAPLADRITSI